jgi:outer membrane protein
MIIGKAHTTLHETSPWGFYEGEVNMFARKALLTAAAGLALMGFVGPVEAAEGEGPWLVRARVVGVLPDEGISVPSIPGAGVEISDQYVPELDISYFFAKNWAVETICCITPHDVKLKNPNLDLGSTTLLPASFLLQYHFAPEATVQPYAGAGVNYTIFFNTKSGAADKVSYDNAFGLALQAGFDYKLQNGWRLNFDVKKIFLETDVKVRLGTSIIPATATIDPLVVGVGFGKRF